MLLNQKEIDVLLRTDFTCLNTFSTPCTRAHKTNNGQHKAKNCVAFVFVEISSKKMR